MLSKRKIIFYLIIIFNFSIVQSAEKIVYLDIDLILNKTVAGKKIIENLDNLRKNNLKNIQKKQSDLKQKKEKIQKQKNILSKEEFKIQVNTLENEFKQFNEYNKKISTEFEKSKQKKLDEFMKFIQPIIENYVKEKSITIVLNKKNIFIASKDYDITDEIINLVDKNGQ